mmetsp:Transcript_45823/g.58848  ORF Transcript_45823/g.58848 Transcript_45823/m.58848 type:complete len:222 (+) Transcript_45823:42-707(+)
MSKCIEFFRVKLDVVRASATESRSMQNFIQMECSRTFQELSGGPLEDIIEAKDFSNACCPRLVIPHGAVPGNKLRISLSINGQTPIKYQLIVPRNATAGKTVMVLPRESNVNASPSSSFDSTDSGNSSGGGGSKKKPMKPPRSILRKSKDVDASQDMLENTFVPSPSNIPVSPSSNSTSQATLKERPPPPPTSSSEEPPSITSSSPSVTKRLSSFFGRGTN